RVEVRGKVHPVEKRCNHCRDEKHIAPQQIVPVLELHGAHAPTVGDIPAATQVRNQNMRAAISQAMAKTITRPLGTTAGVMTRTPFSTGSVIDRNTRRITASGLFWKNRDSK